MVILENVAKKSTAEIVSQELTDANYETRTFFANSASFGVPQSRKRLYIVGVARDKVTLVHPSSQWSKWMKDFMEWAGMVGVGVGLMNDYFSISITITSLPSTNWGALTFTDRSTCSCTVTGS